MGLHFFHHKGDAGDRLYSFTGYNAPPREDLEKHGNSIRCYSKPIGVLLSIFGVASKVLVNEGGHEKVYYVNKNSLTKFSVRYIENIQASGKGVFQESIQQAQKLHQIFLNRQVPYNEYLTSSVQTHLETKNTANITLEGKLLALVDELDKNSAFTISETYTDPLESDSRGWTSGVNDCAYVNAFYGFGYVADGTGHGNEMMAKVLNRLFADFNKEYIQANLSSSLQTRDEYRAFVEKQMKELGEKIDNEKEPVLNDARRPEMTHMNDPTLKPAISFAQVAKIDEQRVLLSVQFGDTMLLIKKAEGGFDTSLAKSQFPNQGIGDAPVLKAMQETVVAPGDIVYGFSDGIGEFLTLEECQKIIIANKDSSALMHEFRDAILNIGELAGLQRNLEILNEQCQDILRANDQGSTEELYNFLKNESKKHADGFTEGKFEMLKKTFLTGTPQEKKKELELVIEELKLKVAPYISTERARTANGRPMKFHSYYYKPVDEGRNDDLSLFSLVVC